MTAPGTPLRGAGRAWWHRAGALPWWVPTQPRCRGCLAALGPALGHPSQVNRENLGCPQHRSTEGSPRGSLRMAPIWEGCNTHTSAGAARSPRVPPPTPACRVHAHKPSTCICGTHTCALGSPRACTLHRVARTHMQAHACARMPREHAPAACTLPRPAGTLHGECCSQQPSGLSFCSPPAPGPSRCSVAALLAGSLSSKDSVQWEEGPSEGLRRGKCL